MPEIVQWHNNDPREVINKRDKIVVCAPEGEVFRAEVETKHGWSIHLQRKETDKKKYIAEDDEWPKEWKWAFAPKDW